MSFRPWYQENLLAWLWVAFVAALGFVGIAGVIYNAHHWWSVTPTSCGEALATCQQTSGWRCEYVDRYCKDVSIPAVIR